MCLLLSLSVFRTLKHYFKKHNIISREKIIAGHNGTIIRDGLSIWRNSKPNPRLEGKAALLATATNFVPFINITVTQTLGRASIFWICEIMPEKMTAVNTFCGCINL